MSILASIQDNQQASILDADLAPIGQDLHRLHSLARCVDAAADRERFASLEHTTNHRLDQLAYVLAEQEEW